MATQATIEIESEPVQAPVESKRTLANRRNAKLSTGPKTAQGKDRSRRNALRSGLAARVVLPEDLRETAERRVEDWTASQKPRDEVQRELIVRGANAMTLLDRCWEELETARSRGAAHAEGFWDRERRAEAVEVAKKLKHAPESTVAKLRLTRQGAEWLMERWWKLGRPLERGCDWTPAQRSLALDLLGASPEFRDEHSDVDLPGADPQALIAHRLEIVLTEIVSLEADLDEFLNESDEIDREIRMKHLVVGVDAEVRRLERYERQLDGRVHACLKMLHRLQESASSEASEAKPKPEAKSPPKPTAPPPRPAEIRRPPEVGGPESLDFVLPSVPPVAPKVRVPSAERAEIIARILDLDAKFPSLSESERAEGEALLEAFRQSQASKPKPD